MFTQVKRYIVKQTALQLNNVLSDKSPITLADGTVTTEYQVNCPIICENCFAVGVEVGIWSETKEQETQTQDCLHEPYCVQRIKRGQIWNGAISQVARGCSW